jgi:hypothetical protein
MITGIDRAELLRGCILSMTNMGAEYVKCDGFDICFNIPIHREINDIEKLRRLRDLFFKEFGLTLKVKRIKITSF